LFKQLTRATIRSAGGSCRRPNCRTQPPQVADRATRKYNSNNNNNNKKTTTKTIPQQQQQQKTTTKTIPQLPTQRKKNQERKKNPTHCIE